MTTRPGKRTSTQPIDAPQQLVGRVLDGRYRLEEVVNVGGMGIIFSAYQMSTGRQVAVKVLRPTLSGDLDLNMRFQQEIETLSALSHPHVVQLFDCGQDVAGLHYLVMEYVDGRTLSERLKACELSLAEILDAFAQVCSALVESHELGIIHRDLKFENIMVKRLGGERVHVTILDFGVAKMLTRHDSVTRAGEIPGTPGIIAPELVDSAAPSPQSDFYSLGVLMFTAITGKAPFEAANEFELMRAHQFEDLPRMEDIVGGQVPEPVLELIYELTQKDPKLRPRDASALRNRLETMAASLRHAKPDQARYIPPRGDVFPSLGNSDVVKPTAAAARSQEFLSQNLPEEEPAEVEKVGGVLLAPTSVVGLLIALLTVLVLVLLYFVYRVVVLKQPL